MNTTLCEQKIQAKYNFTDSLYIQKVDFNSSDTNSSRILNGSVSYNLYDPISGIKYNISQECPDISIPVKFPIPSNTTLNVTSIINYQSQGYNLLNTSDMFYNDRCTKVVVNGVEVTLNKRRNTLFPNQTSGCSSGCSYGGLDNNSYIICKCQNNSDIGISLDPNAFSAAIGSLNIDVVSCISQVSNRVR